VNDFLPDYRDKLNIREQLSRIDRNQAEIVKLQAETRKLNRERWVILVIIVIAALWRLPETLHDFSMATVIWHLPQLFNK
jgi:hypothetical protein